MQSLENKEKIRMASQDRATSTVNATGTDGKIDTPLTQPRSRGVLEQTCRDLIVMRDDLGATTAPGYRCSNTVELLETPPHPAHMIKYFTEEGEVYWRNRRTDNIEQQAGDLQRLLAVVPNGER
jgi:hypothetical protein